MSEPAHTTAPAEHGDRDAFLRRIRSRQGPPPASGPHPPPEPPMPVPEIGYRALDGVDAADREGLLAVFVAALEAAHATVDVVDAPVPAEPIWEFVAKHEISTAVTSGEAGTEPVRDALQSAGVRVEPHSTGAAAAADLALTAATHAIAVTGSVVVDTASAGSRAVSLLPRVHLCVVRLDDLVPSPADVLRRQDLPMPSCRVVITGPSRTGDIEQRLITGAHGPVDLHAVVVR